MKLIVVAQPLRPGARIEFRDPTTSALVDVFWDADLTDAHTQPIIASADGLFPPIYVTGDDLQVEVTQS